MEVGEGVELGGVRRVLVAVEVQVEDPAGAGYRAGAVGAGKVTIIRARDFRVVRTAARNRESQMTFSGWPGSTEALVLVQ